MIKAILSGLGLYNYEGQEKETRTALLVFGAWVVTATAVLTFDGGHVPHWIDVGNGETVVAYVNGVVRTTPFLERHCELWQAKDGTIMATIWLRGPSGLMAHCFPVSLPATPKEVAKWEKVQGILAKNI